VTDAAPEAGKRVSWVELYLDLVFVLAVSQLAHVIVAEPAMHSVWIALGLFVTLWWTWIGFAVLYNRLGADVPRERLLFLAGSVPAGVAAVAIDPASVGESTVFALSLAATRVVLATAHVVTGQGQEELRRRNVQALLGSTVLFVASIWVPEPWRYVLWAVAIASESGAMLREDRRNEHRAARMRRERSFEAIRPTDPAEALDPHHFAERFGLFIIILLGEVVVSAGQTAIDGHVATFDGWAALVAAMIFAAALWWLYFDAAAEINLKVLEMSGGSPVIARAIFATGHMLPAFALLLMAAGVGLLLEPEQPRIAYALVSVGLGIYLLGTRVFLASGERIGGAVRALMVAATFALGALHGVLSPHAYLWLVAVWAVVCASFAVGAQRFMQDEQLEPVPPKAGA
jgi:low temperature requirement protein LtrA